MKQHGGSQWPRAQRCCRLVPHSGQCPTVCQFQEGDMMRAKMGSWRDLEALIITIILTLRLHRPAVPPDCQPCLMLAITL